MGGPIGPFLANLAFIFSSSPIVCHSFWKCQLQAFLVPFLASWDFHFFFFIKSPTFYHFSNCRPCWPLSWPTVMAFTFSSSSNLLQYSLWFLQLQALLVPFLASCNGGLLGAGTGGGSCAAAPFRWTHPFSFLKPRRAGNISQTFKKKKNKTMMKNLQVKFSSMAPRLSRLCSLLLRIWLLSGGPPWNSNHVFFEYHSVII